MKFFQISSVGMSGRRKSALRNRKSVLKRTLRTETRFIVEIIIYIIIITADQI